MDRMLVLRLLVVLGCASLFAGDKKNIDAAALVGDWTGTSLYQVRPSPCHDEQVVFRLSHPRQGKINVQADKMVNGKAVTMGADDCSYDPVSRVLSWVSPRGTWKCTV